MYTGTIKKQGSFDIEQKMAEGVEKADSCDGTSDDCE